MQKALQPRVTTYLALSLKVVNFSFFHIWYTFFIFSTKKKISIHLFLHCETNLKWIKYYRKRFHFQRFHVLGQRHQMWCNINETQTVKQLSGLSKQPLSPWVKAGAKLVWLCWSLSQQQNIATCRSCISLKMYSFIL